METAKGVADTIVCLCVERGIEVSNLKLQKLLYYSQAWHLVIHGQPLFDDDLEAWVHGPVVARVFGEFKRFRWGPIKLESAPVLPSLNVRSFVNSVIDAYGALTATQLERLTHTEPPWKDARRGLAPDMWSRNIISHQSMRDYYSQLV